MEPWGSEQYSDSDLYVYTKYGSVCCNHNNSSNNYSPVNSSDIYRINCNMYRNGSTDLTDNI